MSILEDDLQRYVHEAWTLGDVRAGLKLIAELSGIVGLAFLGYTALTVWVPGLNAIGIPISTAMAGKWLMEAAKRYPDLPEDERAAVRKATRWLSYLFSPASLASDMADVVDRVKDFSQGSVDLGQNLVEGTLDLAGDLRKGFALEGMAEDVANLGKQALTSVMESSEPTSGSSSVGSSEKSVKTGSWVDGRFIEVKASSESTSETVSSLEIFHNYDNYLKWFKRHSPAKQPFSKVEFYHSLRFKKS